MCGTRYNGIRLGFALMNIINHTHGYNADTLKYIPVHVYLAALHTFDCMTFILYSSWQPAYIDVLSITSVVSSETHTHTLTHRILSGDVSSNAEPDLRFTIPLTPHELIHITSCSSLTSALFSSWPGPIRSQRYI